LGITDFIRVPWPAASMTTWVCALMRCRESPPLQFVGQPPSMRAARFRYYWRRKSFRRLTLQDQCVNLSCGPPMAFCQFRDQRPPRGEGAILLQLPKIAHDVTVTGAE
jgi:hypothetical protein